ncbi:TerD family protein [Streptomyces sp. NPDC059491]|uniref:TerD family protein n=1 Tax=Streptomyces sp. NPDC059491 TaxID=3346850 RepID=UPI0036CD0648
MTQIIKGENLPVPGQVWRIEVVRRPAGDEVPEVGAFALLLDATGKAVEELALEPAGTEDGRCLDRLDLDIERAGADVHRIVIVAVGRNGMLGQVPGLTVRTLSAATGRRLAQYEIDGATTETALVLGEYYRRDGGWKFRAVGEGDDAGLQALLEDFGISLPAPPPGGPAPVELPHAAVGKSAGPAGPAPVTLPRGAVGKSSGLAADTERGHGAGPDHHREHGGGRGLAKGGSAEAHASGSPTPLASADLEPGAGTGSASSAPYTGQRTGQSSGLSSPEIPSRRLGAIPVVPSPTPSPEAVAAAQVLGGEFDDIVYSGRGSAKFTMEATPPPGYVLVDFARTGKDFFDLRSIDWDGRAAVDLGGTDASHRFERRVMWCDNLYPLRFHVTCYDGADWTIVIRPVSAVPQLGESATGRGSEVFLHTGPVGELVSSLRSGGKDESLRVQGYEPRRPDTPATFPVTLASEYGRSPKDARVLPGGPLLVAVVQGAGEWSLEVRPARPDTPERKRSGFWRRLGRS